MDGIPEAFLASADVRDDDPRSISTVTLRVPVDRFDEVRALVREQGSEVVFEDVGGRDVTAEFTDVDARLRTAEAAERQLLEILATARTVQDTLDVQRELLEVRSRIEVLQGQLNVLTNQTDLATITVRLHPAPDLRIERFQPEGYFMHGSTELPIMIANHGTVDLRAVVVRDKLAPGMVFEWASSQGVYEAATQQRGLVDRPAGRQFVARRVVAGAAGGRRHANAGDGDHHGGRRRARTVGGPGRGDAAVLCRPERIQGGRGVGCGGAGRHLLHPLSESRQWRCAGGASERAFAGGHDVRARRGRRAL